ncbi:hypothetical protein OH77DRAFT_410402 [Trametes cingulata]|nr:hypothetical protein OH77DRAFT_410402 [Trametes cingulata]
MCGPHSLLVLRNSEASASVVRIDIYCAQRSTFLPTEIAATRMSSLLRLMLTPARDRQRQREGGGRASANVEKKRDDEMWATHKPRLIRVWRPRDPDRMSHVLLLLHRTALCSSLRCSSGSSCRERQNHSSLILQMQPRRNLHSGGLTRREDSCAASTYSAPAPRPTSGGS